MDRSRLITLALAFPIITQLMWASQALSSLPALTVLLMLAAVGYVVAASAPTRPTILAAGFGLAALSEGIFVAAPLAFVPGIDPVGRALNLVLVAGLAWLAASAWRARGSAISARTLMPGASLVLASTAVSIALGILSGETFLVPGYALQAAGWGILVAVGATSPIIHSRAPAPGTAPIDASQAGARP